VPQKNIFLHVSPGRLADATVWVTLRGMDAESQVRDYLRAIRTHIDGLPQTERLNALLKFVAVMLEYLTREQVLSIRAEMVETFGELELAEALNLLDGHLALRDLRSNGG
jgi:hypothetical protein